MGAVLRGRRFASAAESSKWRRISLRWTPRQVEATPEAGVVRIDVALDSKGAPQADVSVRLAGASTSRTGPDGQFAFDDLPEGEYHPRAVSGDETLRARQLAFEPVDGAFRFPDVPLGPYEVSFGHRESDGSWVSRGSTRIEVRSGETTSVDLD